MATVVDALIVTLGLEASGFAKGADKTESRLLSMVKKTLTAVGAFQLLKNTVSSFAEAGDDIGRFASLNGIAVEQVQSLDNAVKISGGSVGEMRGTVADLNKQMTGLYPVNPFAIIGVRATDSNNKIKPMTALLAEVAGKMEGLAASKQLDIGSRLGLDSSTIFLLQKGRSEVEKMFTQQAALGKLTKDDTNIARQFNAGLEKMKIAFFASSASLSRILLPALTWMSDKLIQLTIWMRKHDVFVKAFFGGMAAIITALVLPALTSMAAATIAATWPLILIGAAIAAVSAFIAALVDDYKVWKAGGESAFGDTWAIAESTVGNMIAKFQEFLDFITPLWEGLKMIVAGVFDFIIGLFTGNTDKMQEATQGMVNGLVKIWERYKESVKKAIDFVKNYASEKLEGIKGFFGFGGDDENAESQAASPAAVGGGTSTSSSTTDMNIGSITVQTQATDAAGIASDLGQEIRNNGLIVNQAEGGMF